MNPLSKAILVALAGAGVGHVSQIKADCDFEGVVFHSIGIECNYHYQCGNVYANPSEATDAVLQWEDEHSCDGQPPYDTMFTVLGPDGSWVTIYVGDTGDLEFDDSGPGDVPDEDYIFGDGYSGDGDWGDGSGDGSGGDGGSE